jgi:tRNA-dihydrouridine synthase B
MQLGPYQLRNNVFVAPMAGVTDRPFRQLCKELGAGYAVSEMAASNPRVWASEKTARRINHEGEMEPKSVQIAGADPVLLAEAARFNVDRGAQIAPGREPSRGRCRARYRRRRRARLKPTSRRPLK